MKRVIYLLVMVMSVTLVFSQGKPCCKNKAKGKVSCKLNEANIEANKEFNVADKIQSSNTSTPCKLDAKNTSIDKKSCSNCTKAPWWKIWAKKKGCCNTST